ncbi:MAG: transglutaminase domain-containing protein, partial [bacterium]
AFWSGLGVSCVVTAVGAAVFLGVHGRFGGWIYARGTGATAPARTTPDAGGWEDLRRIDMLSWSDPRGNETVLFRIKAPQAISRFRVQAFDAYESSGWDLSIETKSGVIEPPVELPPAWPNPDRFGPAVSAFAMDVLAVEGGTWILPTAGTPVGVYGATGFLRLDAEGAIRAVAPLRAGARYTIQFVLPDWSRAPLSTAVLASPLDARFLDTGRLALIVAQHARSMSGAEASPWGRALRLAEWLRTTHTYQFELARPPDAALEPVEHFIFKAAAGNCLNFASALTLMARSAGVGARLAVGYLGHRYDTTAGEWLITGADAHAWTEIPLQGFGWVPMDATPPGDASGPHAGGTIGPDPASPPLAAAPLPPAPAGESKMWRRWRDVLTGGFAGWVDAAARTAGAALPWAVPALGLAGVLAVAARGRRRTPPAFPELPRDIRRLVQPFLDVKDAARRRGIGWKGSQTPVEFARRLSASVPAVRKELAILAAWYTEAVYGEGRGLPGGAAEPGRLSRLVVAELKRTAA